MVAIQEKPLIDGTLAPDLTEIHKSSEPRLPIDVFVGTNPPNFPYTPDALETPLSKKIAQDGDY